MYYMYSHASRILLLVQGRKYATMLIMHTIGLLSNRIIPTIMSMSSFSESHTVDIKGSDDSMITGVYMTTESRASQNSLCTHPTLDAESH